MWHDTEVILQHVDLNIEIASGIKLQTTEKLSDLFKFEVSELFRFCLRTEAIVFVFADGMDARISQF